MKKTLLLPFLAILCACGAPCEKADFTLSPGERGDMTPCYIRAHVDLDAVVRCSQGFDAVCVGRGDTTVYWGAELHVTRDSVIIRDFDYNSEEGRSMVSTRETFAHGLRIGKRLRIGLSTGEHDRTASLTLRSGGRHFSRQVRWHGGGVTNIVNDGSAPVEASLSLRRRAAGNPVWFLGDSYFSEIDPDRWPYYMVREGYTDGWMADHIPGGTSAQLLESFRSDLRFGHPRTAVWMLGMNDKDVPGKVDPQWLDCVQEFLAVCDSLSIEPVLVTVPSVPGRCHDAKTQWVRDSGRRYIDWYAAVGASPWREGEQEHSGWKDGLLYIDGVHPGEKGAEVLWNAVKEGLPELQAGKRP